MLQKPKEGRGKKRWFSRRRQRRKSLGKVHFLVENKAKKTDKRLLRDVWGPLGNTPVVARSILSTVPLRPIYKGAIKTSLETWNRLPSKLLGLFEPPKRPKGKGKAFYYCWGTHFLYTEKTLSLTLCLYLITKWKIRHFLDLKLGCGIVCHLDANLKRGMVQYDKMACVLCQMSYSIWPIK